MQLIQSKKIPLPMIYLVEDEGDLLQLPLGIPYIRGSSKSYNYYVRLLEFEVLLKTALASKLPFRWEYILQQNGYKNFRKFKAESSDGGVVIRGTSPSIQDEYSITSTPGVDLGKYVADISYQVDIEYLKNLKIIPTWFAKDVEEAVKVNILNSITYNPTLFNKKLNLMSGAPEYSIPQKNLIIIDVSGSIPVSISKACLLLSKTMATQFYADLIITGRISTFYDYTEVDGLDVDGIYELHGNDNDQTYFKNILKEGYRKYNTAIVFGDNHNPSDSWQYSKKMSIEEGQNLCNWEVQKIMSFHVTSNDLIAGYARWFKTDPSQITYMKSWVHYLDK